MDRGLAVALTAFAGGLVALQAPINSTLGKSIGTFAAASVSFVIGTIVLVVITVFSAEGFGDVGQARHLDWYYLTGGLLGAIYVTTVLVSVRTIGAGGVAAATITGQLSVSVLIDRIGILGLEQRGLSGWRLLGIVLLAVGTFLVVRE